MNQRTEDKIQLILKAIGQRENGVAQVDDIRSMLHEKLEIAEIQDLLEIIEQSTGYVKTKKMPAAGGNGVSYATLTSQGRQYLREMDE